jgi:DNA gyrase/topoisomerase IV subunit A
MKLQGYHNDISNQLAHLTTMVTRSAGGGATVTHSDDILDVDDGNGQGDELEEHEIVFDEAVIYKITENQTFIANTVSHIMKNTNLAELVTEVNAVKTENRELRSILNSQHEMMNGMNALLFTLLNNLHRSREEYENKTKPEDASEQPQEAAAVAVAVACTSAGITLEVVEVAASEAVAEPAAEASASTESEVVAVAEVVAEATAVAEAEAVASAEASAEPVAEAVAVATAVTGEESLPTIQE